MGLSGVERVMSTCLVLFVYFRLREVWRNKK
jgi:hypothetical protein